VASKAFFFLCVGGLIPITTTEVDHHQKVLFFQALDYLPL
jgi:hypothetical protein